MSFPRSGSGVEWCGVPLRVVSCCAYLTGTAGVRWRHRDYDAHDFVMAVKGKSFDGYAQIPCRGRIHRIDDSNRDQALALFGAMIADAARTEDAVSRPLVLVPVPNSRCDTQSADPPRTTAQAEALARELGPGAVVWDGLRWATPLHSARSGGGTRDPQALFDQIVAITRAPRDASLVVLVDDVLASGGHLQACAARIRREGCNATLAVVAGRAGRMQVDEPFTIRVDLLPVFVPRAVPTLR